MLTATCSSSVNSGTASYSALKLALEDFRPTIQAAEVLLNAYTSHSDLLQDLMEVTKIQTWM